MRISDWSSDVCSYDLAFFRTSKRCRDAAHRRGKADRHQTSRHIDLRRQRDDAAPRHHRLPLRRRSEEHTSELQSLMRISYAVFCLKKKKKNKNTIQKTKVSQT